MGSYVLTRAARADLKQIGRYTTQHWGEEQAETYLSALHIALGDLAALPDMGRQVKWTGEGYLRFDTGRHAVFYRKRANHILIVRVLHQSMEPKRHLPGAD